MKALTLSAPVFVWWDITKRCNFRCQQCYSSSGKASGDELTLDEVFGILKQLAAMGVFYICLLGGEPLLREGIFEILKECQHLGLTVMFTTNGWFVNEKTAAALKETGISIGRVSIDGADAETHDRIRGKKGAFNQALHALELLKAAGIPQVGVSPTLMKDNCHQIKELIDLVIEHGADEVQVVQLCATGRGADINAPDLAELFSARQQVLAAVEEHQHSLITATEGLLHKQCEGCVSVHSAIPSIVGCGGGRNCAAIDDVGNVSPCILYRQFAGNLRKQSFGEIWAKSPLFEEMRQVSQRCEGCRYSSACGGPCPIVRKLLPENMEADFVSRDNQREVSGCRCNSEFASSFCLTRT